MQKQCHATSSKPLRRHSCEGRNPSRNTRKSRECGYDLSHVSSVFFMCLLVPSISIYSYGWMDSCLRRNDGRKAENDGRKAENDGRRAENDGGACFYFTFIGLFGAIHCHIQALLLLMDGFLPSQE